MYKRVGPKPVLRVMESLLWRSCVNTEELIFKYICKIGLIPSHSSWGVLASNPSNQYSGQVRLTVFWMLLILSNCCVTVWITWNNQWLHTFNLWWFDPWNTLSAHHFPNVEFIPFDGTRSRTSWTTSFWRIKRILITIPSRVLISTSFPTQY